MLKLVSRRSYKRLVVIIITSYILDTSLFFFLLFLFMKMSSFSMQNTTHHQCSKSTPISTLLCDENDDKSSFLQDFDENPLIICTNTCYFDPNFTIFEQFEDDDHHINILLQREISSNFIHKPHISANSSSFFRNYAISYIFHVSFFLNFYIFIHKINIRN